jgi:hypothetical protein
LPEIRRRIELIQFQTRPGPQLLGQTLTRRFR